MAVEPGRSGVVSSSSHWGAFEAVVERGEVVAVRPRADDPHPSPLLRNIPDAIRGRARVTQPMVRRGWLEQGPGPSDRRGAEPFVPVAWDRLVDLLAGEYRRVRREHGDAAIFGGSYGWASAGRFHHAQSQLHRFLNVTGGHVGSFNTYSNAAGEVILNRVAAPLFAFTRGATTWDVLAESTDLVVAFGGMPIKNVSVSPGGASRHTAPDWLRRMAERGARFVLFSPIRDDLPPFVDAEWLPIEPGTDVAAMLALAFVLFDEGLADRAFLNRCCVGAERFERYVLGRDDGQPKDPEWAAAVCGVPAGTLRDLARRMAAGRTLVNVSWSLQRAEHGEQPPWAGLALAAVLGQVGLPGGGFGFGYGSMAQVGEPPVAVPLPHLPQGANRVGGGIPVARVADMLLGPGERYPYDGAWHTYPDIRLVAWAGGNPFHHHQDLARLRRAFARPETIVVHDPFWTATARHADIVVPSTVSLERDDIGAASNDRLLLAMRQAVPPLAQARDDYAVLADLADATGCGEAFTEGRSPGDWLRHLYESWREGPAAGIGAPDFDAFWRAGSLELPVRERLVLFEGFRADPDANPLPTPSGRIELFSAEIDRFGLPDCPGHPAWLEPTERRESRHPLLLIANNPATRLHSQLDPGEGSAASKVQGREPIRIHPADASARGIAAGEVVRVFNERGACLAGAVLSGDLMPGVVQLSTGAWYDPVDPGDIRSLCGHGNPNVLTRDAGTSGLAQGCSGHLAAVEVERWDGPVPPVRAFDPPMAVGLDNVH